MISKHEDPRATIAAQAAEWFVANDAGALDAQHSAALVAWLTVSATHVEEFLRVAVIARDLRSTDADPEHSVDALVARAREQDDDAESTWSAAFAAIRGSLRYRWKYAAIAAGSLAAGSVGLLSLWSLRPTAPTSGVAAPVTVVHLQTRHGEQQTYRLADNSLVHLNTDSAMTVRYTGTRRLAELTVGEADFEVAHDPKRTFRVAAGPAEIVDLGTRFAVRLESDSTLITVVEGRVAVGPSQAAAGPGVSPGHGERTGFVELSSNQQISVVKGESPGTPQAVDAQRATAWLHREIIFEREPLARVASEFNRYAPKPIEITTPKLRDLEISGVFATDDSEAFIAFLRTLEGVRVDVTAAEIRVSQK